MKASAAEQYRKELKKHLSLDMCSRKLRTELLSRFDAMLGAMKEDYPEPAMAQLETAFGTPAQMAETLLAGIPQEKRIRRQSSMQVLRKILVTGLILALAGGLIYAWWFKSFSIHTQESILIFQ